jgi:CBS domain-containing protein
MPTSIRAVLNRKSTQGVLKIASDSKVSEAVVLLSNANVGALVVADEQGMPMGIFSERDVVHGLSRDRQFVERLVKEVTTKNFIFIKPDDQIQKALMLMTGKRVRHLPVFEAGEMVGLVSIGDLVAAQFLDYDFEVRVLHEYIEGQYPV